jgi:hypothetical protein
MFHIWAWMGPARTTKDLEHGIVWLIVEET